MTNARKMSLFDRNDEMTAAMVNEARRLLDIRQPQSVLLSGGNSPCDFYRALGQENLAWAKIDLALVDERWVDEDDDGSNAALIRRTLMANGANEARFTVMKTDAATPHLAEAEVDSLYRALPQTSILGMGPHHSFVVCGSARIWVWLRQRHPNGCWAGARRGNRVSWHDSTGAMLKLCREAFLIIKGNDKITLLENCLSSPAKSSPISRAAEILGSRLKIFALRGEG